MPIFEYSCRQCQKKFTQLVGMTADSSDPACPKCGSADVHKLISRFSRLRSDDEVLDSLENAAMAGDMDDPRTAANLMREMGKGVSEEGGEDFEEAIDEAERGLYDGSSEGDIE